MIHPADDSRSMVSTFLPDEEATLAAGRRLAAALVPGVVIHLRGDLGAGKTTLTRGVLRGLGWEGKVRSPTYTLVEIYAVPRLDFNLAVYHFDFYRLGVPEEYAEAGLEEYFDGRSVCLVEWPDKAAPFVPAPDLEITLEPEADGRALCVQARTERGIACLTTFLAAGPPLEAR